MDARDGTTRLYEYAVANHGVCAFFLKAVIVAGSLCKSLVRVIKWFLFLKLADLDLLFALLTS